MTGPNGDPATPSTRASATRRTSARLTKRQRFVLFAVIGFLVFLGGLAAAVVDLGPKAMVDGYVVRTYTDPSAKLGTTYWVDLEWPGGQDAYQSLDLYNRVNPLAGARPVSIETSLVTGGVLRVRLDGEWFGPDPTPQAGLGAVAIASAGLVIAVWFGLAARRARPAANPAPTTGN